ncbi:hypothetical protein [Streptomyces sp. LN785]|uniref:hypothetical protein n=1 Tax=Streptomyces sp. LN785 TaxID=3112983 RepID=UPI003710497F
MRYSTTPVTSNVRAAVTLDLPGSDCTQDRHFSSCNAKGRMGCIASARLEDDVPTRLTGPVECAVLLAFDSAALMRLRLTAPGRV